MAVGAWVAQSHKSHNVVAFNPGGRGLRRNIQISSIQDVTTAKSNMKKNRYAIYSKYSKYGTEEHVCTCTVSMMYRVSIVLICEPVWSLITRVNVQCRFYIVSEHKLSNY